MILTLLLPARQSLLDLAFVVHSALQDRDAFWKNLQLTAQQINWPSPEYPDAWDAL